jgi:hypothetical protein
VQYFAHPQRAGCLVRDEASTLRDHLIAKLKTLTTLRVVRDEESSTGWKLEVGPFPGWAEVPEW